MLITFQSWSTFLCILSKLQLNNKNTLICICRGKHPDGHFRVEDVWSLGVGVLVTVVLSESLSLELSSALSQGEAPCWRMHPSLGIAHVQWLICGEWIKTRPCVSIRTRVRGIPAPRAPYRIVESCLNSEFALQFSSPSDQSCFPCCLTGKVPRNPDPPPSSHPNLL